MRPQDISSLSFVFFTVVWSVKVIADPPGAADAYVVPVDWSLFAVAAKESNDCRQAKRMLLNCARYNLAWMPGAAERIESGWREMTGRQAHDLVRPACAVSYATAVVLKAGVFAEEAVGLSQAETLARLRRLIRVTATAHDRKGWKYPWQSAFWAALLGHGGWLVWHDLDAETRRRVADVVQYEADRFLASGYSVPCWNGNGGDTKAEESAWNSMIFHVACAMMPRHPNVPRWKEVCSELMASAYAREADMGNETVLDGKPLREWLAGYNARDDGTVVNHGFVHPDYMTCVTLKLRAHSTQSLVGRPVPESAGFGATTVYRALVTRRWPSPPFKPPGGTIYVPGRAEVYYPQGTDWFAGRIVIFYVLDVYAHRLGFDRGMGGRPAEYWMRLRAGRILQRQSQHAEGNVYGPEEFTTWPGREQDSFWLVADAFLLQWLADRGALSPKGNWREGPSGR